MQIITQFNIWINLVFMDIISNFVSIHYSCWDFYASTEIHIGVAEVISKCLNIVLSEPSRIEYYLVMYRLCSCNGSFMRNQEKVKQIVSLTFYKPGVNHCSWAWVYISISIVFIKKSMTNLFINKAIKNLWHIIGGIILNSRYNLF